MNKQIELKRGELVDLLNQEQAELQKNMQIEEMKNNARIYIGAIVEKLRMDGCELYEIDGIVENILNYITITEDSVILSKGAYESLSSKAKANVVNAVEIRKETAEKIFNNLLKEFYKRKSCGNADVVVYEIAKQYGVEIKE